MEWMNEWNALEHGLAGGGGGNDACMECMICERICTYIHDIGKSWNEYTLKVV